MSLTSDRILELREQLGLTKAELSRKMGVSKTTIKKWEEDLSIPREEAIKKLADIFDVDALYLLGYQSRKKYTEQDALEFERLHIHIGEFTTTKLDLENLPNLDSILRAYTFSNKKGRELLQDIAELILQYPEKYDAEIK